MPLKDVQCSNKECENFKKIHELLLGISEELPKCEVCNSDNIQILSSVRLNTVGCSLASKHGIH